MSSMHNWSYFYNKCHIAQAVSKQHTKIHLRIYYIVHIVLRAQQSLLHPNHGWLKVLHQRPLRGSGRHHHFDPSCKTLYEPFNSCGTVPVAWLHGRMASISYQFRFCWVIDASLMFTDWTPFCSRLCGNNGALSILNFSVYSLHEWTVMSLKPRTVQTGQTKSIGTCLFYTILPPAWCISLLILSMVPSQLSFFPNPSASCRLRLSSCRATAATQIE